MNKKLSEREKSLLAGLYGFVVRVSDANSLSAGNPIKKEAKRWRGELEKYSKEEGHG